MPNRELFVCELLDTRTIDYLDHTQDIADLKIISIDKNTTPAIKHAYIVRCKATEELFNGSVSMGSYIQCSGLLKDKKIPEYSVIQHKYITISIHKITYPKELLVILQQQ